MQCLVCLACWNYWVSPFIFCKSELDHCGGVTWVPKVSLKLDGKQVPIGKKKCHFYSQILWTGLNGHFTLDPGHQCYILFFWHKVFFLIFVQCWASSNVCKKINKKTWCSSQRLCCFHRFQPATCVSFHSPVSSSWLPREPVESRVKDVLSLMLVRFVIIWHSSALTCTEPRSEILWCKFEHADCMKEKGTWVLFF